MVKRDGVNTVRAILVSVMLVQIIVNISQVYDRKDDCTASRVIGVHWPVPRQGLATSITDYLSALLIVMCRPERSWAAGLKSTTRPTWTIEQVGHPVPVVILSVNTTDLPVVFETSDYLGPATSPGRRQNSVTKSEFDSTQMGVTPAMLPWLNWSGCRPWM